MAKASKEFTNRMEGMIFAYNVAKKAEEEKKGSGLEALKNDIKMRGFFRAPMKFTTKQIDEYIDFTSKNLYATMSAVTLMTLRDEFGFAKVRLDRFMEAFDKKVEMVTDFSKWGNHYATLEDYAIWLNQEYNLGLDVERVAMCQENYSKEELLKGKADIKEVYEYLKEHGEERAAKLVEEMIA